MRKTGAGMIAAWALSLAAPVGAAQGRVDLAMTERAAAAALMDGQLAPERDRALALALELGPRAGAELRGAVIEAAWAEWKGETGRADGSEEKISYLYAVIDGRDPRGIPLLLGPVGSGPVIWNALADFGPAVAFGPVIAAAANPEGNGRFSYSVVNSLTALRFMVEDGSLGPRQLERVRDVVRDRLSGTQGYFVVEAALYLGIVLGDPDLRERVERIATDRAATEALVSPYLSDGTRSRAYQRRVDEVQEHARELLSGALPRPHRDPPR